MTRLSANPTANPNRSDPSTKAPWRRRLSHAAAAFLIVGVLAPLGVAQIRLPYHQPERPKLTDSDKSWAEWYKRWLEHQEEVNGYDVKRARQYKLESDWSVIEDFSCDQDEEESKNFRIHVRAFRIHPGKTDPYFAHGRGWGKAYTSAIKGDRKRTCSGTCIWNFRWTGSVGMKKPLGFVSQLKGRIMGLGYARAYNAKCGTHLVIGGEWSDSLGYLLKCPLGVAAETNGELIEASLHMPFLSMTFQLDDGQAFSVGKCKDHTALHDATGFGTPQRPWRVWVKHRAVLHCRVRGFRDNAPRSRSWGVTESVGEVTMNFTGTFTETFGLNRAK